MSRMRRTSQMGRASQGSRSGHGAYRRTVRVHGADRVNCSARGSQEERQSWDERTNREDGLIREDRMSRHDHLNGAAAVPREAGFTADWLTLREGADAAARASELLEPLRAHLSAVPRGQERAQVGGSERTPSSGPERSAVDASGHATVSGSEPVLIIRDLGCGTGSMGRWLAGRLPGPQRWIMHDRDPALLARAGAGMPERAADGSPVAVETRRGDLTGLRAGDLAGTSLVTASALLDLLTAGEVDALAAACVEAGCAALLTLSVAGEVEFAPSDPLDAELAAAFDAHQRRVSRGRRLLGPDAVAVAAEAYERRGARVLGRASPWRLGPDQAALTAQWLRGWVGAAVEQRPDLARRGDAYLRRRLDSCAAGGLRVTVHHRDLLAIPRPAGGGPW
jgi:hypothetical protein